MAFMVSSTGLAQKAPKDPCDKFFFKERKSKKKSTAFSDDSSLKTKYSAFYANGQRVVSIAFIQDAGGMKLFFYSAVVTVSGSSFKNEIILGQNITIAFVFEDETTEMIEFESSEQEGTSKSKTTFDNQNEIALTDSLLTKLATVKLIRTEIKNPFNNVNTSKVKVRDVPKSSQKRILEIATCFTNKTTI